MLYTPNVFLEQRQTLLWQLLQQYPFGLVVSVADGESAISHVPFLVDPSAGVIFWHMARANPQAATLAEGAGATLVFQGPHGYISPRWYAQPAVPTWNYVAVHASGAVELLSGAGLAQLIKRQSRQFEGEGGLGNFEESGAYAHMQDVIVGFRMQARLLQGKLKLSQNRSNADRAEVIRQLLASPRVGDQALGQFMRDLMTHDSASES